MPEPSSRLHVLLVCGTSAGGVGSHVRTCARGLAARGHVVRVAAPAETGERFGFADTGATFRLVEIADRPHPSRDARAAGRLRHLCAGADVVHAHGIRAGALAVLALAGAPGGPSLVVTLHNAAPSGRASRLAYAGLERLVASRADLVLAVSEDLAERMTHLGARAVDLAHVPALPQAPARRSRADVRAELRAGERPLLLTVARLAGQKGLPLLLEAAARWARRTPMPLVVVAGDGPLRGELADAIGARDLPVCLLGRRDDVPDLLAAADVFVLPSVWEGQPLVLQEALRAGLPIVATDVGGVRAVVGEAAVLVPYGDASALAGAVHRLLKDPARLEQLAGAARQRATRLPTDADVVAQLEGSYARAHETAQRGHRVRSSFVARD